MFHFEFISSGWMKPTNWIQHTSAISFSLRSRHDWILEHSRRAACWRESDLVSWCNLSGFLIDRIEIPRGWPFHLAWILKRGGLADTEQWLGLILSFILQPHGSKYSWVWYELFYLVSQLQQKILSSATGLSSRSIRFGALPTVPTSFCSVEVNWNPRHKAN